MAQADELYKEVVKPNAEARPKTSQADALAMSVLGHETPKQEGKNAKVPTQKASQADALAMSILGHETPLQTSTSPSTATQPDYRKQIYDSTIGEGYSEEQAQKRVHEFDYATSQGLSPENSFNLASSVAFDRAEKKFLTEQERDTVYQQAKKHAEEILEANRNAPISDNSTLNTEASKIIAAGGTDAWARGYTKNYAQSKWKGYSETDARAHAGGEIDENVYDFLRDTGLSSDRSYLLSDEGERYIRFSVAKTADSLEKSGHPYVGAFLQGLTEMGIGLTTPSMVAIGLATKGAGAFSKVEPFAEVATAEGTEDAAKATSIAGRWRRAYKAAKATTAAAARKAAVSTAKSAGETFAKVAPDSAAGVAEATGKASESVAKATEAIRGAKLPVSAVHVARTINEATHAYFSAQMTMGAMQGAERFGEGTKAELERVGAIGKGAEGATLSEKALRAYGGDYSKPVAALLVNTVIGGLMAYGGAKSLIEAEGFKIKADAMTEKLYGTPGEVEGEGPKERPASKFSDLNDYQQAVVLTKLIEEDPAYSHAWVETKKEHDRRMKKLNYRYNQNLQKAWNPDAVQRAVRVIDYHQAFAEWEDEARAHYLKQITKLINLHKQDRADEAELAEYEQERRAAGREGRPVRKTEAARKREEARKVTLTNAAQIAEARQGAGTAREEADRETAAQEQEAAETLAQIKSLRVNADYALEEHGSTPEREAERTLLRNLERQLVDGEITGEQARKGAGLPEEKSEEEERRSTTYQEIEAARAGALYGLLYGRTIAQFEDDFLSELESAGWNPEDIEAAIDTIGPTLRMVAENNLHYVGKSGDYIVSKKGVTWRLDKYGMLQPDGFAVAPIPLMKNGRYTAQAIDLAMSGKVGFGRSPLEEQRVEVAKEHTAAQMLDNLSQAEKDELERAVRLSQQNEGLLLEAGELPAEKPVPNRKKGFAPPVERPTPEMEEDRTVDEGYDPLIEAIGSQIENPESHAKGPGIIARIAKNSGLTPAQVVGLFRESEAKPDTLKGKIEWLRVGDTISDKMGLPWVVEGDANGKLYLRKGEGGARIPFDKDKPSDTVRRIVGNGEVQSTARTQYTPEDARRIVFESSIVIAQNEAIERVKELAENPPPPPRTQEQAEEQVKQAEAREAQVNDAAVEAIAAAVDPTPKATDEEIDKAVAKAEELRKVAEAAAKQTAEAQGRAAGPGDYPQKAPITSKRVPRMAWAVGHEGYIQTNASKIPMHRELVKLSQLTPSFRWNGNMLERVPEYPEQMQDVPPDEATRQQVLADAQPVRYDVDHYLDPGHGPERGPAIVDGGGDVAGGNRRLLRMMKYLELIQDDKVALAQFRAKMADYAQKNGMIYPEGDEIYIPVRMMDEPIGTIAKATKLGNLFNKKASHGIDENAKSITYGRMLYEAQRAEEAVGRNGVLDRIADEFNSADTPRDAMANRPEFFANIVRKELGIGGEDQADWFNKNAQGEYEFLSTNGKEKLEKALLATVLKNPSTLDTLGTSTAYDSLLKSIGPMTRLRAVPDKDITGIIEQAIQATAVTERMKAAGDSPRARWNKAFAEHDFFSEDPQLPEPDRMVEAVWRSLHDRKTTRFKNALNDYLVGEGIQKGFFDPAEHGLNTPADLFNAAFEDELKDVKDSRGVNSEEARGKKGHDAMQEYLKSLPWELTQDQFDAAMRNQPEAGDPIAKPIETKVREGKIGDMLGAGETRLTATGRETTPFPKIDTTTNGKATNTVKRVDQWLMDNAIAEAKARGDHFAQRQFEAGRDKPQQADKDSAEIYLFDKEIIQPIPRPFTKPLVAEKPGALTPPPEPPSAAPAVEVGQRVTFTPNNFNHNDVVGVVRDVITNTSGAKGYQIIDDAGVEHRVWERDGTIGSETKAVDQKAINSLNDEERKLRKRQATLEAEVKKPSGMVPPAISSELNSKRGVELNDIRKRLDAIVDERRRLMQGGDGDSKLAAAKAEKGYVTPDELRRYLEFDPETKGHVDENMWTAQMLAERVYDADPPVGVDRKDALAWVLERRVSGIGRESGSKGGAFMAETRLGRGYILLYDNAHAGTFTHEFAHAIFPLLSAEDMKAINSIEVDTTAWEKLYGKKWNFPEWDGRQESLKGEVFDGVTEKLAYGLEKFRRDEKPTGFNAQVGIVLTKIWNMFRDTYREIIKRTKTDPLSPFKLSDDARQFLMDTFHIEETDNFNAAEDWKKKVDAARKAEAKQKKGMVKPEEVLHSIIQIAKDLGPTPTHVSRGSDWPIIETANDRVDPSKTENTVVLEYPDRDKAAAAFVQAYMEGSGISGVEYLEGPDGKGAIRFNWGLPEKGSKEKPKEIPNSILYQEVPKRNEQLQIEKLEDLLKKTSAPFMQQFVRTQIKKLESEIRAKYGVESPKIGLDPEAARKAIAEVKRGTAGRTSDAGRERVSDLRGVPDGPLGDGKQSGVGRLSKPPVMGMPGYAGARGATDRTGPGRGNAQPVNLANVAPVKLNPLPERGAPVGIMAGEAFDEKAWRDGLKRAGLPENMPAPTVTLSPEVARTLKYAGQKQIVQTVLSALEQGDGAVIASVAGSGKTWTEMGVVKETILRNPDAKILVVTMNRGLLEDGDDAVRQVAKNGYDLKVETDIIDKPPEPGVYGATYQRLLNNSIYSKTPWDLVIADEAGAARNWYRDENQQGKLLKVVMENSKKGVYVSATPFHSPNEYGYAEKLNLWPKGGFEGWIKENFAHEKVGDKIVAKLDPAKQAKLREQMVERGQFISQQISYDGFSVHFGVVPVTDVVERKLDRIHQGVAVMKRELLKQGKKGLSERVSAFEATYTKAYLERSRLPEAIQLIKRARAQGWQVAVFSETTSEDLFRRPVGPKEEPGTYRLLDEETGGQIGRIMPEFVNIADQLRAEFGDEMGDYSGVGNTDAQREEAKQAFLKGEKKILYTSYAAGGIGINLQDKDGDKPRLSIFLGPPYSGILLEQSLARTWRLGVKSNARAVFLATDSEPDIRLMSTKIGPRMRALSAAVLGDRDSLASVMSNYSDEEKMREHQDMMAFDQGNEIKVDAQGFQVRSKRKVNFDNWSSITFPNAEEAKNKGMQVEMSGGGKGSDWATLYQEKPKRWEPPNRPLTIEDIRIRRAVNAAADKAAANPQIPHEEITMTAVRAEEVAKAAPEGVDKEAAAEGVMKTLFRGEVALQGEGGGWTVAHDAVKNMAQGVRVDDERPWKKRLWDYQFSQDSNIVHTLRKLGKEGVGWNIVNMREDFYQKEDQYDADHLHDLLGIFTGNKLNPHDENTVRKIIDVVEGHQAVADPAINKAAGELSEFMKRMRDFMAEKNVSLVAKDGTKVPYKNIAADPKHIPHFINYDAKLTDPKTGETKTLREVMGHTFGELNRLRYMEEYARKIGKPVEEARVWIADLEKRMKGARLGQVRAERSVNIPFYYKDFKHLVKYVEQVSTAASMEETFGGEMENLKKEIAKVPNEQARKDILTGFTTMFEVPDWNTSAGKIVRKGQGFEALTKMPLSVLKVPFHLVHATMKVGLKSVGKAGIEWLKNPNEFRDEKFQLGVTGGRTDNAWILEGGGDHGLGGAVFKGTGFDIAYRWVRGIAGESAKVYMEQRALGGLKKGGSIAEEVRRILKHTMLIGDHAIDEAVRTGKWSEDDLEKAQRAFANKVTFNSRNPGQMPELARMSMAKDLSTAQKNLNTSLRGTYALQSFTIKTYSFLRDALYDEVVIHHNLKPLIPFLLLYPVAGQLITGTTSGTKHIFNLTSEKIQDKEHVHDSWDTWLQQFDNIEHHPVIGALKFWIDGACVAAAMERTKRVADLVLLMSEGHKKQADDMMKYWIDDELEQDFGSIYTDMLYFAKAGTDEVRDLWKYTEDHAKQLTATEKHVFGELEKLVPLSKDMPYVDDLAHQYIKTGPKKWAVEGGDDEPPKEKRKKWAAPTPWD